MTGTSASPDAASRSQAAVACDHGAVRRDQQRLENASVRGVGDDGHGQLVDIGGIKPTAGIEGVRAQALRWPTQRARAIANCGHGVGRA